MSVSGSGLLLLFTARGLCDRGRVLSDMRNRSGGPNALLRALALLLALVLAWPLTLLLFRVAAGVLHMTI